MSERTRRILLIAIFVAVTFLGAFAIWWFFFRPVFYTPPQGVTPSGVAPSGSLTPAAPAQGGFGVGQPTTGQSPTKIAQGGLTETNALTTTPVLGAFTNGQGGVQYYNRTDGKFYRVRADGTIELLSNKVFFNVSNVVWAPNLTQGILEYPDGSKILYDFDAERQVTLPKHWQQFSFANDSRSIAFLSMGADEDSRWLATAHPDGSGIKAVEPLGSNASKVQVAWSPENQIIAFSRTGQPQDLNTEEVLFVGANSEHFKSLLVNGIGFQGRWSPDGKQILYSVTSGDNEFRPQLWLADGTPQTVGTRKAPLGLNTWADKCTFASATSLYCAIPTNLPAGVGLYPAAAGNTTDQLWHINLTTGARELKAIPSQAHTITSIVVSGDERSLYYTDKISGQLYKINLK